MINAALIALWAAGASAAPADCENPRHEKEAAAAVERVAALEPEAARGALERLSEGRGEAGLRGRPVTAALLSLRGQGLTARRAVYCAAAGGRWVGVETDDGRFFHLPLGVPEDRGAVDLGRLSEVVHPRRAGPALGREPGRVDLGASSLVALLGGGSAAAGGGVLPVLAVAALRDALAPAPRWQLPDGGLEAFCARKRCRTKKARATIDTDGYIADPALRAVVASPGFDKHHQSRTHMSYAGTEPKDPARYLDATKVPYVVRHKDSPWRLGDIVVVEYGGRRVAAVVGDSGKRRRLNEISFAAAERLGIDPHGNRGGTDASDPVTVTALSGLSLKRPADERELLGALTGVQRWLDRGQAGPRLATKGNSGAVEVSKDEQ